MFPISCHDTDHGAAVHPITGRAGRSDTNTVFFPRCPSKSEKKCADCVSLAVFRRWGSKKVGPKERSSKSKNFFHQEFSEWEAVCPHYYYEYTPTSALRADAHRDPSKLRDAKSNMWVKYTRENNSSMPVSSVRERKSCCRLHVPLSSASRACAFFSLCEESEGKTPNAAAAPSLVFREEITIYSLLLKAITERK